MNDMIFTINNFLFGILVMLSNIVQGLTGFGGSLLAMPFAIHLQGLLTSKMAINTYGLVSSIILFATNYKFIIKKEAIKITFYMLLGMIVGVYLTDILKSAILLKIYAIFIILVVIKEVFYKGNFDFGEKQLLIILLLAGAFQGMFISGGPFLIIYVTKKMKNPDQIRGTLGLIWVFLYFYMMVQQYLSGQFTSHNLIVTLFGLPFVFAGVFIGSKLVKRVNREKFLKIVYSLLLVAAMTLLV